MSKVRYAHVLHCARQRHKSTVNIPIIPTLTNPCHRTPRARRPYGIHPPDRSRFLTHTERQRNPIAIQSPSRALAPPHRHPIATATHAPLHHPSTRTASTARDRSRRHRRRRHRAHTPSRIATNPRGRRARARDRLSPPHRARAAIARSIARDERIKKTSPPASTSTKTRASTHLHRAPNR